MKRRCKRCKKYFIPKKWNHIFCGSKLRGIGCSWLNSTSVRNKRRWQNEGYRLYQRRYSKNWRKEQRHFHTAYAERQRQLKRAYYRTERGRNIQNRWRRRNVDKVLFWNKKRILRKKRVIGSHTWEEWKELKGQHQYRCAICGISEKKLEKKWATGSFTQLTEDHIVPIAKGGTDFIRNIQPLCISCNANKKDT